MFEDDEFLRKCKEGKIKDIKWFHSLKPIGYLIENGFMIGCEHGKTEIALYLYEIYGINKTTKDKSFKLSCGGGHFETAKWIQSLSYRDAEINIESVRESFKICCENGHTEVAKWIHSIWNMDKNLMHEAFYFACKNGCTELAEWLFSFEQKEINDIEKIFKYNCCVGNLKIAQILYLIKPMNIHINEEYLFRWACLSDLSMAKWLHSLGNINMHAKNDEAFRNSCNRNQLEIAKWLYEFGVFDIFKKDNFDYKYNLFTHSCLTGNIEFVQWLCSKGAIDIRKVFNEHFKMHELNLFAWVCSGGHKEMAKWLYLQAPDLVDPNTAFRLSCNNGYLDISKWLYEVFDNIDISNMTFAKSCSGGYIKVAKWIYSLGNIDIRSNNDSAFICCCMNDRRDNIELAKWLCLLCDDYKIEIVDNKIVDWDILTYVKLLADIDSSLHLKRVENLTTECVICLQDSDVIIGSKCGHTLCLQCVIKWKYDTKGTCPFCRKQFEPVTYQLKRSDKKIIITNKSNNKPLHTIHMP